MCVFPLNALYAVLRPFAVSRYVMIPKDTQRRSKRIPDVIEHILEHYTLCYCVSYCIDALRHPQKTQERKGFIYDDC